MKSSIVEHETGFRSIDADFESKSTLIEVKCMQGFFSDKPEASIKLNELRKTVETYNEENAARSNHNIQPVPVKSTVLDMSEERITEALNGIIQIQMCVLQNERELISLK